VAEFRNVAYQEGPGTDPVRHRLDLYLPKGKQDFPVVVFVHGGGWILGDKEFFGWGEDIGRFFAGQGIGAVMPSYRLAPAVRNPQQVQDVARAFAWTVRNIRRFGGCPERLFLCGHSAGGQLVSLLATDPSYLRAEAVDRSLIKGVISISGVYRIPEVNLQATFSAGSGDLSQWLFGDELATDDDEDWSWAASVAGRLNVRLNAFSLIFGAGAEARARASPLTQVRPGLPPFLIIYAANDWPLLAGQAREFAAALRTARCRVRELEVKDRDHEHIMFNATTAADPVARAIEGFVRCPNRP
jgi:acetyl esterase/lipase